MSVSEHGHGCGSLGTVTFAVGEATIMHAVGTSRFRFRVTYTYMHRWILGPHSDPHCHNGPCLYWLSKTWIILQLLHLSSNPFTDQWCTVWCPLLCSLFHISSLCKEKRDWHKMRPYPSMEPQKFCHRVCYRVGENIASQCEGYTILTGATIYKLPGLEWIAPGLSVTLICARNQNLWRKLMSCSQQA